MSNTSYHAKDNNNVLIQGGEKKVMKKILSVALSTAMAFSMFASVAFGDTALTTQQKYDALKTQGIFTGYPDGQAHLERDMTRAEFAKVVAGVAGLEPITGKLSFKDKVYTSKYWAAPSIEAVYAAGLMQGKNTTKKLFFPKDKVTVEEMATVLVRAMKLEIPTETNNTASNWAKGYVQAAINAGVIPNGGNMKANATRAQLVEATYELQQYMATPVVKDVKAVSSQSVTLSGTGLHNLKAENISMANNTVKTYTASADGKSATVTFNQHFAQDTEQVLKVTANGATKEYKFTYGLVIGKVTLNKTAYDDNTSGQAISFKINDEANNADINYLMQAGYNVDFVAVKGNVGADIFVGNSATSSTGILKNPVAVGDYTVEVRISKAGKLLASDRQTISILDIETATSAINSASFGRVTADVNVYAPINSTTLKTGEEIVLTGLKGNVAGKTDVEISPASASLSSSNVAVASVSGRTIKTHSPGTATITIKVGAATKTVTFTVTNDARVISKVTANPTSVKLVTDNQVGVGVSVVDQYGDPVKEVASGAVYTSIPVNANGAPIVEISKIEFNNKDGKMTATVKGLANGSGTVYFKDSNKEGKVLGSLYVEVSNVNNVGSQKLEVAAAPAGVNASSDATLDLNADKVVFYELANYNTLGQYNGVETLGAEYTVESLNTKVATAVKTGDKVEITAVSTGKADVVLKKNGLSVGTISITVTQGSVKVTKVNFKAAYTVDYNGELINAEDVLDIRPDADASKDKVIHSIEHDAKTADPVRIKADGTVYIDGKDSDIVLGNVVAEVTGGSNFGVTTAMGGYTTGTTAGQKDKGTIIFKFVIGDNVVAATSVNVDVK